MPPYAHDDTAPRRRPRHAAGAAGRPFAGGSATGGSATSGSATGGSATSGSATGGSFGDGVAGDGLWRPSGRHRRPETLADRTQLRPAPVVPSQNRRSVQNRFELGEFEESFIERGFQEPTRTEPRSVEASRPAESPRAARRRAEATRTPEPRRPDPIWSPLPHRVDAAGATTHRPVDPAWSPAARPTDPAWSTAARPTDPAWSTAARPTDPAWSTAAPRHGSEPHAGGLRRAEPRAAAMTWPVGAAASRNDPLLEPPWTRRAQKRWRAEERRVERARRQAAERTAAGRGPTGHGAADEVSPRLPGSGGRGKHAAPGEPVVTVRALPFVQNAMSEGLPAARRAADAVREWALYTGDKPPATGTHRAPGTLPIEDWLLVGRGRQQALLASLVAAGLALVMIPIQHHENTVDAVNAAHRSAVSTGAGHQRKTRTPATKPAGQPTRSSTGKQSDLPDAPAPQPSASAQPSAPAAPPEPVIAVPPGSGPAQSLRVTGSSAVALTFDDGPDPDQTPKILALLDKYQVKATFCLIGKNVRKHPEIVRQIVAAGHTLCNHTWDHSLTIGKDSPAQIRADLEETNAAIRSAVPDAQIPFFRAPGGNFTDRLVQVAYGEQMTSLYWQVDPADWDHSGDADDATHTERVIASVQKFVKPGSIILSHDFNQPDTITAYEALLPWLTENFEIGLPVPPALPVAPVPPPEASAAPQ